MRSIDLLLPLAFAVAASPRCQGGSAGFEADLTFLTSERVAGRAAGSDGDRQVIAYLAGRMRALGLAPLPGLGDAYRQPIEVADPRPRTFVREDTELRYGRAGALVAATTGTDALPFAGSRCGEVAGRVAFCGYGLRIEDLDHDDYRGLDVRGKVVLVLRGAPCGTPAGARYGDHADAVKFATKMRIAAARGAVGFLLCSRRGVADAGAREIETARRARGDSPVPAMWVTRALADRLLGGESLDALQARADRGPAGAGGLISEVRVAMRVRMGPVRDRLRSANVLGLLRGGDAALRGQLVVVGAHHDHLGRGEYGSLGGPSEIGQVHPGADDNASGVAGMLELARRLRERPQLRRSVLFAAFGAEECGMAGSTALLRDGPIRAAEVAAMIDLDMIGRGATGLRIECTGSGEGWQGLLARVAAESPLAVLTRETGARRSDHLPFLEHEVPSLLLHTGLHAQFHRPSDVAALVQVDEALAVVDVLERIVVDLADRPERVRYRGH